MLYSFRDKETGGIEVFEMKLCERDQFITDHPHLTQVITHALPMGDSVRLGITQPPNSFMDKLDAIKAKVPKSNMDSKHWGKNIREI